MNEAMQDHASEQTARLDRLMQEHRAFIDAKHKQQVSQTRQSAAIQWGNAVPGWFIAVGYAAGLVSLIVLGVPILLNIGRLLAACG